VSDFRDDDDGVDWGPIEVRSRAGDNTGEGHTALGDPTRWGSTVDTVVATNVVPVFSHQVVRVQAADAYPRNWQMTGTLDISSEMYGSLTTDLQWTAYLEILQGQGQAQVLQWVNLRALMDLAVTPSLVATGESWYVPAGGSAGPRVTVPWVLPGGLVANVLNVRAVYQISGEGEAPISIPQTLSLTALVSCFAAGHKL
jgi:hypothetical protein